MTKKTAVEVICYGLGARRACQIADNLNPPTGEHTKHEQRIVVLFQSSLPFWAREMLVPQKTTTPMDPYPFPLCPKKNLLSFPLRAAVERSTTCLAEVFCSR